jgi:hypothetical protein
MVRLKGKGEKKREGSAHTCTCRDMAGSSLCQARGDKRKWPKGIKHIDQGERGVNACPKLEQDEREMEGVLGHMQPGNCMAGSHASQYKPGLVKRTMYKS